MKNQENEEKNQFLKQKLAKTNVNKDLKLLKEQFQEGFDSKKVKKGKIFDTFGKNRKKLNKGKQM